MKRSLILRCLEVMAGSVCLACASHRQAPQNDPAALAALHADLRILRGESTWVARGSGYELVGRTPADLVAVQPTLDRAATFLRSIYPLDSVEHITATVRRAPAPGKPFVAAAPVPADAKGLQVELVLIDPKTLEEQRKNRGGATPPPMRDGGMRGMGLVTPAIRAWLASRATKLTGGAARFEQLRGEADDPRVPAWAVEMVGSAGNGEMIDNFTKSLAAHEETLIPLASYFTMAQPMAMGG